MNREEATAFFRTKGIYVGDWITDPELAVMVDDFKTYGPDGEPVFFVSEPMKIGKHDWRISVFRVARLGQRCTLYEYREAKYLFRNLGGAIPEGTWKNGDQFPGYRERQEDAWPKRLEVLYRRNEQAVNEALGRKRVAA